MLTKPAVHKRHPDTYLLFGVQLRILLSSQETAGQFCMVEGLMPPGCDAGLHMHIHEDESMHLYEGELEVTIGEEVFTLRAGESYFAPRNVPQRLRNLGNTTVRAVVMGTPGGFDEFVTAAGIPIIDGVVPEVAPPTEAQLEAVVALAERHGIRILRG
ncbi:cupin domain-containing protein [Pseudomonas sp. SDO5271_S396]